MAIHSSWEPWAKEMAKRALLMVISASPSIATHLEHTSSPESTCNTTPRLGPVGDSEYVQRVIARYAAADDDGSALPDFLLGGEDGTDSNLGWKRLPFSPWERIQYLKRASPRPLIKERKPCSAPQARDKYTESMN